MNNIKAEVVKSSLKHFFNNDNSFSICHIDKLIKITKIEPDPETYDLLSALHCVNYQTEMSEELRNWVKEAVCLMFNVNPEEMQVKKSFLEKIGLA